MAVYFIQKGSFTRTDKFLNFLLNRNYLNVLDRYGRMGVEALRAATPKDTGYTADCWTYEIIDDDESGSVRLVFSNTNVNKGQNIAILLQYGHATRNGGYVEGRDYINPVIQPIFDDIANACFREVTSK